MLLLQQCKSAVRCSFFSSPTNKLLVVSKSVCDGNLCSFFIFFYVFTLKKQSNYNERKWKKIQVKEVKQAKISINTIGTAMHSKSFLQKAAAQTRQCTENVHTTEVLIKFLVESLFLHLLYWFKPSCFVFVFFSARIVRCVCILMWCSNVEIFPLAKQMNKRAKKLWGKLREADGKNYELRERKKWCDRI